MIHQKKIIYKVITISSWILIGVIVSTVFHYPIILSSFNYFPGDEGDSRFVAYLLEHLFSWFKNISSFSSPSFFYPAKETIGFSDTHLLHAFVFSLIRLFEDSILKSFSISIFILNTFTYFFSFCFIRYGMKLNLFPSIAGALIFSFNSAKLNQLNHTQLQPLLLIPIISWLFLLIYEKCKNDGNKYQGYIFSFFAVTLFHLQLWTSFYIAWFYSIILLFGSLVLLTSKNIRIFLKNFLKKNKLVILFSSIVFLFYSIPFLKIYLPVLKTFGGRSYQEIDSMLPRLLSYFWMGDENIVWGWIPNHLFHNLPMWHEHKIGIGLIFSFFAVMSFIWALRSFFLIQKGRLGIMLLALRTFPNFSFRFDAARYFLLIGCLGVMVFFVFSLRLNSSLWNIIYDNLPGGSSIRAVTRYTLIAYFFVGIFISVVLNEIENKKYSSKVKQLFYISITYLLIVFGIFEQKGDPWYSDSKDSNYRVNTVIKKLEPNCDSFYLRASHNYPKPFWVIHIDAMLASHLSQIPTLNGYSGHFPKEYPLWNPKGNNIKSALEKWKSRTNLGGNVCLINHDN